MNHHCPTNNHKALFLESGGLFIHTSKFKRLNWQVKLVKHQCFIFFWCLKDQLVSEKAPLELEPIEGWWWMIIWDTFPKTNSKFAPESYAETSTSGLVAIICPNIPPGKDRWRLATHISLGLSWPLLRKIPAFGSGELRHRSFHHQPEMVLENRLLRLRFIFLPCRFGFILLGAILSGKLRVSGFQWGDFRCMGIHIPKCSMYGIFTYIYRQKLIKWYQM